VYEDGARLRFQASGAVAVGATASVDCATSGRALGPPACCTTDDLGVVRMCMRVETVSKGTSVVLPAGDNPARAGGEYDSGSFCDCIRRKSDDDCEDGAVCCAAGKCAQCSHCCQSSTGVRLADLMPHLRPPVCLLRIFLR